MSGMAASQGAGAAGDPGVVTRARMGVAWLLTAAGAGVAGALFLAGLDLATGLQRGHPWLLGLLPVLGVAGAWWYRRADPRAAGGTALLLRCSRLPDTCPPFAMAPLIVATTLLTHVGGGSAGREGTALQLGGGWAAGVMRWLRMPVGSGAWLLPCGMAAGFAAVFGTPWAAAVFVLEVVRSGERRGWRWAACLGCAWAAHGVALGCGARHSDLALDVGLGVPEARWLAAAAACGVAMGVLARGFLRAMHLARRAFERLPAWWMRPMTGGVLVGVAVLATGQRGFLGLGMEPMDAGDPSILGCLRGDAIAPWAWAAKLAFTVATVASGFRGGEVTPLFFIGAAAGHALGAAFGAPPSLVAAAGMASLFGAASRAPWGCAVMGMELFGCGALPYVAAACAAAWASGPCLGLYEDAGTPMPGGDEVRRRA
jgi:H+/Cl- antiporter ClcA